MRLVGLISGGKDSVFNMLQCIAAGHEIVAVANIEPAVYKNEMDSYMYQTVGHQTLSLLSAAISLPIYRHKTKGIAICQEKVYVETPEDEVEDLYKLISKIKEELHIDGVSVGAIESDYQRTRVENICMRLNLKCYAYLWKRNQEELLQEMIDAELDAVVVKVAALGLEPEAHLGARIKDLQSVFVTLNKKFGVNICGEGGEYETLTVDCPLYHRRIQIIESEKIIHSDDAFAPVGILSIKNAKLESKTNTERKLKPNVSSSPPGLDHIKNMVKPPSFYVQDCIGAVSDEKISSSSSEMNEILPFPFGSKSEVAGSFIESKTVLADHLKSKSVLATNPIHSNPHASHTTFSPSSATVTDSSVIQLNHSTGWCCIGNVSASSIKEGLTFVQKHLERFQYIMRDVVAITLYVRDMGDWSKINKTYSQTMPALGPPTRGCVAVPLPPDVAVVMTVVAHRLVSRTQKVIHYTQHTVDKEFIHVQSISHWAPANIGPYSQCVRVGEIVYVAGQIPLIPGTMELLNRPIPDQCRLALRHVSRILKAVNETFTMENVMCGVCFVTKEETAAEISGLWDYITKNEHAPIAVVVVSTLPKNASLEWLVLGCGYNEPEVSMGTNTIEEEFLLRHKRCFYVAHNAAAMVCNVSFAKKQPKKVIAEKGPRVVTSEDMTAIMKECVQILRGDLLGSGTPLCMFTVYYKSSSKEVAQIVNDLFKSSLDFKVVVTPIPVLACQEPSTLLTITGVCH